MRKPRHKAVKWLAQTRSEQWQKSALNLSSLAPEHLLLTCWQLPPDTI